MSKGKRIDRKEKAKMREKRRNGATPVEIAQEYGVSVRTVQRAIVKPQAKERKRGRPTKLSRNDQRNLMRKIRENPLQSAKELIGSCGISVSARTVQRFMVAKSLRYRPCRKVQPLLPRHKEKRLEFARSHVSWKQETWNRVIFSDEKKWNLRGNDGKIFAWQEEGKELEIATNRSDRRSIMVWGAIDANGPLLLVKMTGPISAKSYVEMLEKLLFGEAKGDLPADFIFQQDNAPPHVAVHTKEYLKGAEIPTLEWPPMSPDLSPIENIWSIVQRKVYKEGKTYASTEDLWNAVQDAFFAITPEEVKNLYQSMPNRMIKVLEKGGGKTGY